ncbi:hypothetical protein EGR_10767 [Echinococcus granulosus]|uniref:Uncharacterized protein n=1 Tax=Echinococcus granulosus TaxID=6210 RepID=W6TZV9_ECHGR|nr:hypothetical protein EGR_10767 [Echinococcus granulosus]EUB54370.1 hypothetical protein EGR_10767 [Echinococcus granulosus]
MDTHDGRRSSPVLNEIPKPDETPDPVKLPRGISDVEVKESRDATSEEAILSYFSRCHNYLNRLAVTPV